MSWTGPRSWPGRHQPPRPQPGTHRGTDGHFDVAYVLPCLPIARETRPNTGLDRRSKFVGCWQKTTERRLNIRSNAVMTGGQVNTGLITRDLGARLSCVGL